LGIYNPPSFAVVNVHSIDQRNVVRPGGMFKTLGLSVFACAESVQGPQANAAFGQRRGARAAAVDHGVDLNAGRVLPPGPRPGPWSRKGAHHAYRRQMARPTRMAVRRGVRLDPASHTSLTFMCVSVVTHK
jgi:hypothetical protein